MVHALLLLLLGGWLTDDPGEETAGREQPARDRVVAGDTLYVTDLSRPRMLLPSGGAAGRGVQVQLGLKPVTVDIPAEAAEEASEPSNLTPVCS